MSVAYDIRTVTEQGRYVNGAARKSPPRRAEEPGEWRCWNCNKYLLRVQDFIGSVEISCHRCRRTNIIVGEGRPEKGTAQPPADEILYTLDKRWAAQFNQRAMRRAEGAVGLRFTVFVRDGFRCRYCGRAAADGVALHADHVVPQSKGGPTTLDNLVTACLDCNLGKSDRTLQVAPP